MYQLSSVAGHAHHLVLWPMMLVIAVFLFVTPVSYFFTHDDTKRHG